MAVKTAPTKSGPQLRLQADAAAELMTTQLVSVRDNATIREALSLFIDKGIGAAPVINRAGHPVGVLSRGDLLIHDRETPEHVLKAPEFYHKEELHTAAGEMLGKGFQVEKVDGTLVRDLMTPAVFSVPPDASAAQVVHEMLTLKVHRLFVVDEAGVLIGVISSFDVLRHLAP